MLSLKVDGDLPALRAASVEAHIGFLRIEPDRAGTQEMTIGHDFRAGSVFRNAHLTIALQPHLLVQFRMQNKKLHDILRKGKTRQPRLAAEEVDESLLLELLDQPVKRGACGGSTLHEDLEMYSQICPKLPAKWEPLR